MCRTADIAVFDVAALRVATCLELSRVCAHTAATVVGHMPLIFATGARGAFVVPWRDGADIAILSVNPSEPRRMLTRASVYAPGMYIHG